MAKKPPLKGAYYLHKGKVYKVLTVSSGTDVVIVEDIADGKKYEVRFALFSFAYERVLKIGDVAFMLGRHPRSIYRYEQKGQIKKAIAYPLKDTRVLRFYRKDDIEEIHEMISQIHQGRPRKDHRVVNNTMPDIATLKQILRERFDS